MSSRLRGRYRDGLCYWHHLACGSCLKLHRIPHHRGYNRPWSEVGIDLVIGRDDSSPNLWLNLLNRLGLCHLLWRYYNIDWSHGIQVDSSSAYSNTLTHLDSRCRLPDRWEVLAFSPHSKSRTDRGHRFVHSYSVVC